MGGGQRASLNWLLSQPLGEDGFPTRRLVGELQDSLWLYAAEEEGEGAPTPLAKPDGGTAPRWRIKSEYKLQNF